VATAALAGFLTVSQAIQKRRRRYTVPLYVSIVQEDRRKMNQEMLCKFLVSSTAKLYFRDPDSESGTEEENEEN
jgi:hypothetical protein